MKFFKNLGQNFLINPFCVKIFLNFINPEIKIIYFEIGFGSGVLSKIVISKFKCYNFLLYFLEIEKSYFDKFIKIYKNYKSNIINFNILYFDFYKFKIFFFYKFRFFIFGNIPYNISLILLTKLINFVRYIKIKYLMLEQNFYIKVKTRINLTITLFFKVIKLFEQKNFNFFPKPKINSNFTMFKPLYLSLINLKDHYYYKKFCKFINKSNSYIINLNSNVSDKLLNSNINYYVYLYFKFKKKFLNFTNNE